MRRLGIRPTVYGVPRLCGSDLPLIALAIGTDFRSARCVVASVLVERAGIEPAVSARAKYKARYGLSSRPVNLTLCRSRTSGISAASRTKSYFSL